MFSNFPQKKKHNDQFALIKQSLSSNYSGVIYISPSLTTYQGLNPSFRVFEFNSTTMELLDIKQYHMNMSEANISNIPKTKFYYSSKACPYYFLLFFNPYTSHFFKKNADFGLKDFSPASWASVFRQIISDDSAFQNYWTSYKTGNPYECTGECKKEVICRIDGSTPASYWNCIRQNFK